MFKALYLILMSLGLALIFNFLFFDKLPGISVFIFALSLLGAVSLFGIYQQVSVQKTWWLIVLIAFFALMPSIRDNPFLTFLNLCATFGLLMIWAHELTGTPAFLMKLRDYVLLMTLVPLRMLGRALSTVTLIGQIHSHAKHRDVWVQTLKGVVMAVPLLIIFVILFAQADLVFSQFINSFVDITISERTAQYLVLLAFAFVAGLSFLSYIFFPKTQPEPIVKQAEAIERSDKGIEVMVFLGLIAALFLVFIGFQMTYLFGGETNIINAGFTYAEYARRGFWELLAVAMLSLLVLLASEKYADTETKKDNRFLIPTLLLIVEVAVIMVSAFNRLSLYIDAYGMTMLRFYVAGFIVLLFALFALLAIKFIYAKREQFFAFGSLLSIAVFLIVVNFVNPDAFIMKYNLEQYRQTGKIDHLYVRELSADAEPGKIEMYKKLDGEAKEDVRTLLQDHKNHLEESSQDWQSANLSRARALKVLEELEE